MGFNSANSIAFRIIVLDLNKTDKHSFHIDFPQKCGLAALPSLHRSVQMLPFSQLSFSKTIQWKEKKQVFESQNEFKLFLSAVSSWNNDNFLTSAKREMCNLFVSNDEWKKKDNGPESSENKQTKKEKKSFRKYKLESKRQRKKGKEASVKQNIPACSHFSSFDFVFSARHDHFIDAGNKCEGIFEHSLYSVFIASFAFYYLPKYKKNSTSLRAVTV